MGTYSFYLTSRNNAQACKINWHKMDTTVLFKSYRLERCYDMKLDNLELVAKELEESKLFGYFTYDLIDAFAELCFHLVPYGSFPIIYYDYEGSSEVHALEFKPGTANLNILRYNYSHLINNETTLSEAKKIMQSCPERGGWVTEHLNIE
jgi:hypothetical protein